jgi:hypothetical protein
MALSKTLFSLLFMSAVVVGGACSASKGETGNGTQPGMNGQASIPQFGVGATNPFLPPPGPNGAGGGGPIFGGGLSGSGMQALPGADGGLCPAIKQTPETITVYRDASVTDTITTYKPVCLFIMQDRSSSMVGVSGDPQSWNNSTAAITAFVNDPRSAGIDIGLGVFPPMQFADLINQGDCATGSDCGQQLVPIAALPGNGQAMINGYNTANPGAGGGIFLTPTECALRGMINNALSFMAQSPIGEQCVAILVTDGAPTTCNQDHQALINIVAEGHSRGVTTFTLGLPGADMNFLNQLANAGGTNASIDVTTGADSFINALNNIRQAVAVTTTTVVSTPMVISTPLPCQWKIPPIQGPGQLFDPAKVNVQFTPPGAPAATQFGYVNSPADCARATGDAWYYDNPNAPTQVLACPQTCNGTLKNSAGALVEVLFGCARKPADIH